MSDTRASSPVEALEARRLLTTYVVNSTADTIAPDGQLTLREAITAANTNAAVNEAPAGAAFVPYTNTNIDRIEFAIGSGAATIALTAVLPVITEPLVIDATTQPGYAGHPLIELDGAGTSASVSKYVLQTQDAALSLFGVRIDHTHSDNPSFYTAAALRLIDPGYSQPASVLAGNEFLDNDTGLIIDMSDAAVHLGGTTAADRNVISGNTYDGLSIGSGGQGQLRVEGNAIGVAADGVTPMGNGGNGVAIADASGSKFVSMQIGGPIAEQGNVIAHNGKNGIATFTFLTARHNSIFANGRLGIGTILGTPYLNDPGDADNATIDGNVYSNFQNFPVISTAVRNADGSMTISGVINSTGATPLLLDFYGNDANGGTGYGEGQTFLATQAVTTDVYGNASFTVTVPAEVAKTSGDYISATATTVNDGFHQETSEFAQTVKATAAVPPPPPALPGLAINNVSTTEGNSGTKTYTFTVTRSGDLSAASTVQWATKDGTAKTGDNDYTAGSGTLTFAAGQATQTIFVTVKGDTKAEGDESFQVNLSSPTNATITDAQGIGTIKNDDAAPAKSRISVGGYTATEGKSGTKAFTFKVTLDKSSSSPVTVKFNTANDSAKSGSDYNAASGTLTFAAGETVKTITVYVKGDSAKESDEKFFVYLTSPTNADIAVAKGTGLIKNDD